jgi:hypothetical protein
MQHNVKGIIRAAMALALAASLVVGLTVPVQAEARDGHRSAKTQRKAKPQRRAPSRQAEDRNRSDYYQHWADKLPFGSRIWFEQMEREGRFGGTERCC